MCASASAPYMDRMTWGTVQPSAMNACSAVTCAQIRRVDGVVGLSALAAGVHRAHARLESLLERGEAEALDHVRNRDCRDRALGPVVVLRLAPREAHDRHVAARDEGLAQFAAEPARRSSDQYGFDHFGSEREQLRRFRTRAPLRD